MPTTNATNGELREPPWLTYLKWGAAAVTALTVIGGGVFGLVHWVFDGSQNGGDGTVAESAKIERLAFTPQGTKGSVDARVHVLGEKGKQVRLVWTLMDAERSQPVQEPGFEDQLLATFKPTSDDWRRDYSARVPAPNTTDLVFLRVRVLDESQQQLDFADTDMFRIGGTPG